MQSTCRRQRPTGKGLDTYTHTHHTDTHLRRLCGVAGRLELVEARRDQCDAIAHALIVLRGVLRRCMSQLLLTLHTRVSARAYDVFADVRAQGGDDCM